ncbi:hypothetical protein CRUP_022057 [Coryphaenoides rupestris]|nr:hypothetical protein CRUP_022057 [Coryphaenoides rupestris]
MPGIVAFGGSVAAWRGRFNLQGSYWAIDTNPKEDALPTRPKKRPRSGERVALYNTDQEGSDSPRSSLNNSLSDQSLASVNLNSVGSVHSYTPGTLLSPSSSATMTCTWMSASAYICWRAASLRFGAHASLRT